MFVTLHPDGETLVVGGVLAALTKSSTSVTVVALTDGDAAYCPEGGAKLTERRRGEQISALRLLGKWGISDSSYGSTGDATDGRLFN